MTVAIAVVLVASFGLFVTGWLKPDLIAMLALVSLVLAGVIEPAEAFAGFSSFAVIAIAGLDGDRGRAGRLSGRRRRVSGAQTGE